MAVSSKYFNFNKNPFSGLKGVPFSTAFIGVLDAYSSNLTGAYSICRRLVESYSGSLIRVRRSGDNSEYDFGYDSSGNLDSASVTAFCIAGGGTQHGYITIVYDQLSGVTGNLVQATAARQPRIVISGVLQTGSDGRPQAVQTAFANALHLNYSRASGNLTMGGIATTRNSYSGDGQWIGTVNDYGPGAATQYPIDTTKKGLFSGTWIDGSTFYPNKREATTARYSGADWTMSVDGVNILTKNHANTGALSNPPFGASAKDGWGSTGAVQEFYIALTALSDTITHGIENALLA